MDKIIALAKEIREDIDNLPGIKEYYRLKELYENDKELATLRKQIAKLKLEGKEKERNDLLKAYNSHPLVNNYNIAKEEVKEILLNLQNIIQ